MEKKSEVISSAFIFYIALRKNLHVKKSASRNKCVFRELKIVMAKNISLFSSAYFFFQKLALRHGV